MDDLIICTDFFSDEREDDIHIEEDGNIRRVYKLDRNKIFGTPYIERRWVLIYEEIIE